MRSIFRKMPMPWLMCTTKSPGFRSRNESMGREVFRLNSRFLAVALPEYLVVGQEHDPARADLDPLLEGGEENVQRRVGEFLEIAGGIELAQEVGQAARLPPRNRS